MSEGDILDQRIPCTAEVFEGTKCHKACQGQARYLDDVMAGRIEQAREICAAFREPFCTGEPSAVMDWAVKAFHEYELCREATIGAYNAEYLNAHHQVWTHIILTHV